MDNLFDLKLNINQIAELTGLHRQTVSQRVAGLNPALGSNSKLKLYALRDLILTGWRKRCRQMSIAYHLLIVVRGSSRKTKD